MSEGASASPTPTVLHVLEALTGGTSRHVADLVRTVGGVNHVVATPRRRIGSIDDRFALDAMRQAGATVHHIEMRRTPWHLRNAASYLHLASLVRRYRPDVIHGHSAVGGALARAVPATRGTARIYTPHGLREDRLSLLIERKLSTRTDRVVAVSDSEGALVRSLGIVDDHSIVVIPNGIADPSSSDQPAIDLRALAGIPDGAPLVGSLGRLVAQKAPERFVECCRLVARMNPEAYFLLIGDGPLAGRVDDLADCAELRGRFVRLTEVQPAAPSLGQLDVFVLLSRFEGGPYTPLEAAWLGTPVVLSDCVGNIDILAGALSRLIAPDGDPSNAADIVAELLDDAELRGSTGAACAESVKDRFDLATMGDRHAELYREVIRSAGV